MLARAPCVAKCFKLGEPAHSLGTSEAKPLTEAWPFRMKTPTVQGLGFRDSAIQSQLSFPFEQLQNKDNGSVGEGNVAPHYIPRTYPTWRFRGT